MPLEKIYEIMKIHVKNTEHILNGFVDGTDFSVLVTQLYFKGNRNGIDKDQVTDDVLAFCSLVMSYAKAAFVPLSRNGSPKQRTVIMPRTNFAALYDEVKSKIPGDLFGLFETLACYKTGLNGRIV